MVIAVAMLIAVIPGAPVAAQWQLTPLWSDVTPGRVMVEPWGLGSGEDARVVVVTEDRRLRLRNPQGTVVATTRTGLREPAGMLSEGPYHSLLIPRRDSGAPLVRLDLLNGQAETVGQPVSVDSVIAEDARFVVTDGESLVYTVSATGLVTHASTASGVLWQRRLPAVPTAMVGYRGAVYVALADGRVFRFDGNGTGIELFRLGVPVGAMKGVGSISPALLIVDRGGAVSLVAIDRDENNGVDMLWRVAPASGGVAPLLAVAPPRGRSASWYAVVAYSGGGITIVDSEGDVRGESLHRDLPIDMVRQGRIPSGGFLVVSDRQLLLMSEVGNILDEVELQRAPATATWIDGVGQLIVTYPDWSIEAWTVAPVLVETPPPQLAWSRRPPGGRRYHNDVSPGALTSRAAAVFEGTSRSERRALLAEIQEQRRRGVLFDRVGEARSILRRLVREALESPNVHAGRVRNDFPEIRRAAVAELGRYLDRTSREALTDVVRHDPDARVAAAALYALARYGLDETGITAHAVARFRRADDRDRTVLASPMIEFLELTSAVQRHPAAAGEALDLLIESNLSREIRRRAATIERARYR